MIHLSHRTLLFCLLALAGALLTGCGIYTPLQIEPARRQPPVAPRFTDSYYSYDRDQNVSFILRGNTTDPATGKPITQTTTIRMFWQPRGGVTTLNPSALNATIRYVVTTPDAIGIYEGAGFVRLNSRLGAGKLQARLMDSDLRLSQASAGFVDTLGRAHMRGYLTATYNDAKTAELLLGAQQDFFARSLVPLPAIMPTGAPAGTQAATQAATAPASSAPAATQP